MALHLLANPTGRGALDGVKAKANELGYEIVATEEHKATTVSEIESLTRIKAKNPDVMFISSTPARRRSSSRTPRNWECFLV